jgi:predicted DNA-binding transcriptional regulator AlpA
MNAKHSTVARKAVPTILSEFGKLPDDAHIGVRSVAALFDAGVSTIWARTKRGELPQPKKFGHSTRWRVGDLRDVLNRTQALPANAVADATIPGR